MRDSFAIGRIFGIQIRVHMLFPLILAFVLLHKLSQPEASLADAGLYITVFFMLFGVVLLHELGHSLVAQSFGIQVLDITFWPLGGMARMEEIPEKPRVEGLVAIAGPAVNCILFLLGLGVSMLVLTESIFKVSEEGGVPLLLGLFVWINLLMGLFNLIPAFPMDGGRILRAWLARKREWVRATEIAVRVGRLFAFFMILAGIWSKNYVLCFIGVWVWWMGARELWYVRMKHRTQWAYQQSNYPSSGVDDHTPGFSSDDLRDLESFRGRLKTYKEPKD